MQFRHIKGFTLIEITIVLTIVGIIIGGIWVAAATVMSNFKMQALMKDAIQVIQNTKNLFSSQGAAAVADGLNESNAIAAGIFPSDMISSASTPANPVVIIPFSTNAATNSVSIAAIGSTYLWVQFGILPSQGMPSSACAQLITSLGTANNVQKYGLRNLGGGADPATNDVIGGGLWSVTPATAATVCNQPGNGNVVGVVFSIF